MNEPTKIERWIVVAFILLAAASAFNGRMWRDRALEAEALVVKSQQQLAIAEDWCQKRAKNEQRACAKIMTRCERWKFESETP